MTLGCARPLGPLALADLCVPGRKAGQGFYRYS
jgi:hypothetical protein